MAEKQRVLWVDSVKGLAIILVVYGHVMQGMAHRGAFQTLGFHKFSDIFVYSFHMPAFFFIGGLFAARSLARGTTQHIQDKLRTLAWPYLVWSVLAVIASILFHQFYNHPPAKDFSPLLEILWKPFGGFWFFYVLFCLHISFLLLQKIQTWILFAVSIVLYLLMPYLDIQVIDQYVFHLPIFTAGLALAPYLKNLQEEDARNLAYGAATLCIVQAMGVYLQWNTLAIGKVFLGLNGTAMLIFFAVSLERTQITRLFAHVGTASLGIYVMHSYFQGAVRAILFGPLGISNPHIHVVLQTLAGVIGALIVWHICHRIGLYWLFSLKKAPTAAK